MNVTNLFLRTSLIALIGTFSFAAVAQSYPNKPLRFIVPYAAGGPSDIQARILGENLSRRLGQQVLIDNRAGASGNIGMEITAKASPDGYTIMIAGVGTWAINPYLYNLPYDVMKDFAPIVRVSSSPGILVVHPSVPAGNVKELISLARARPAQLNYGSSGVGGFGHISGELFMKKANVKLTHVPYKSAAPALNDVISGQIEVIFNNVLATVPHVRSNRLRALATTGEKRLAMFADVPTISEAGVPGYENSSWSAIAVPARTPGAIIERLNREFNEVLKDSDTQKRFSAAGSHLVGGTPEQFRDYLKAELEKFGVLVKEAGIKPAVGG